MRPPGIQVAATRCSCMHACSQAHAAVRAGKRTADKAPARLKNRQGQRKKDSEEPLPYLRKEADPDVRKQELARAPDESAPQGLFALVSGGTCWGLGLLWAAA